MTHPVEASSLVERYEVGTVVGFMHPTAEWCHRDYSAVSPHCQIGGPAPVALIRQSEAADRIEQLERQLATARANAQIISLDGFGAGLRRKLDASGMSLRDLTIVTGVDKASASRATHDRQVSMRHFVALWNWLHTPRSLIQPKEGQE